jgi:hypothetical protein
LKQEVESLRTAIASQALRRDELVRIAQEEADGTGGSRKKNLGPIYKVKKADAEKAEKELQDLSQVNLARIHDLEITMNSNDQLIKKEISSLERSKRNGLASRIEALDRLTKESAAIAWAHWFILLLFIAIETAPVFVKLISSKGPYDNLLKIEEHAFVVGEIETLAKRHAEAKERNSQLPQHERAYINDRLDASLKRS